MGRLRPDSSCGNAEKEAQGTGAHSPFWREEIPLWNPCTLTLARAEGARVSSQSGPQGSRMQGHGRSAGGDFSVATRLAAGGAGRGRAPPYTFHARLPHKVGLCLDPLAPSPGKQQQRGRRGRARRGGDGSGSSGPAIPGLERISGDTGGTWCGSVPAEPKRDAGPQAQPSWGAAQATRGGPG